ncbi:kinase-like domain-containing protein [Dunaliella salina]|uniref:Kinase-like domain-containing protein n=1 Tax=Dunaliella salina TaxID=3046 RepID=A0ABQ7H2Z8_DUNSA|nr:kinase-like domain-containing protein [Dunaliella salina]|eukprot:KAF5841225.1 kinase-like domain-containing protein [Dunaliella salina]
MGCMSSKDQGPPQKAINSNRGQKYKAAEASTAEERSNQKHNEVVQNFSQVYKVERLLGTGAEGNAWLVRDVNADKLWALKLLKLPLPARFVQSVFREIRLQSELGEGHHNIITPEEVVLTSHYLGLVMEYAPGGSMTQYITDKFRDCGGVGLLMPEDEARFFFKQMVNAVDYCHRHQVVHRDLKLDNTLLSGHNPPYIKLCDFGFARNWDGTGEQSNMTTVIGTPDYMSPQLTAAKTGNQGGKVYYDGTKADVWAMGVLLCVILIGKFPFEGDNVSSMGVTDPMKKVWVQQHRNKWDENSMLQSQLKYLSPNARDLLDKMFDLDEKNRISIQGIMEHPWYQTPMRSHFEDALGTLKQEQDEVEEKLAKGAYRSAERDAAIDNLIKLSASGDFKSKATEPIHKGTIVPVWTRLSLRTVQPEYPIFNRDSLRACLAVQQRAHGSITAHAGSTPMDPTVNTKEDAEQEGRDV